MVLSYSIMMNPCGSPLPRFPMEYPKFVVQCARSSMVTGPVHWFVSLPNSYKHLQSWLSWFEVVEGLRCTNVLARDAQIKNKVIDQTSSNSFPENYKSSMWVCNLCLDFPKKLYPCCTQSWKSQCRQFGLSHHLCGEHSENKKELLISSFILLHRMLLWIRTIHLFFVRINHNFSLTVEFKTNQPLI